MGYPISVYSELVDTVTVENVPLETALKVVTSNVADVLKLKNKGRIEPGKDADLVLIGADFKIQHVIALGQLMMKDGKILKKGSYERD
jgi:beta-aspartyl-dipeptidase (metallo-type)